MWERSKGGLLRFPQAIPASLESQYPGRKMSHTGFINCTEQKQFPPLSATSEIHKIVAELVNKDWKTGAKRSHSELVQYEG